MKREAFLFGFFVYSSVPLNILLEVFMEILLGLFGISLVLAPLILALINADRLRSLTRRMQRLEFSILRQQQELEGLTRKITPVATEPTKDEIKSEPKAVKPEPGPQVQPPLAEAVKVPMQSIESSPQFPPPPIAPHKTRSNREWEALIGGKVLNRVGALALILGVGFFLKYAFDNEWISETVRVVMGAIAGASALVGSSRVHKKGFEIFSQGLVGAGVFDSVSLCVRCIQLL